MLKVIIAVIIMFGVLITGHEFGHFITAKAVGIKVNEFAIGMGPAIFQKQCKETLVSLRVFPIGGYCAMEGEDTDSFGEGSFNSKSNPQKMLVVAAGAIMNFLMAIVILFIMSMMIGNPTNIVMDTVDNSPAEQLGIQAGDRIVSLNGNPISEWTDLTEFMSSLHSGDEVSVVVERGKEEIAFNPVAVTANENGAVQLGVYSQREADIVQSMQYGVTGSVDLLKLTYKCLGMLITGEASVKDVVGPVGVVSVMDDAAKQSWYLVLYLAALISVNLAVINLLPLPALDGGRLLFLIIGAITRKPLNQEIEGRIHYIGLILFMALALVITVKDINQFILK